MNQWVRYSCTTSHESEDMTGQGVFRTLRSYPSLNCSDIGYPDCPHVAYGVDEEVLFRNAKHHAISSHGYTEESWEIELTEKVEHFRKLSKMSFGKS
jgi:predicted small metal-binding protein